MKSTPQSFHWIFFTLCSYITDILKMCMKKFDDDKNIFDELAGFNWFLTYIIISHFSTTAPGK